MRPPRLLIAAACCSYLFAGTGLSSAAQTQQHVADAIVGKLIALKGASLLIATDEGRRTCQVNLDTKIWRGAYVGLPALKVGDDLIVRYHITAGAAVAEAIWANIDRRGGMITAVKGNLIQIAVDMGPDGAATIEFNSSTEFVEGSVGDLKPEQHIELIGLVLNKHKMLATRVLGLSSRRIDR